MDGRPKGASLYAFAIGIVMVTVGVTFMYLLPNYIVAALNQTGAFAQPNTTPAQCAPSVLTCNGDYTNVLNAQSKVQQVQAVGFAVIIIGLIFMIVGVISKVGGG